MERLYLRPNQSVRIEVGHGNSEPNDFNSHDMINGYGDLAGSILLADDGFGL